MSPEEWQQDVLAAGDLYRVGGAVRDRLGDATAQAADTDFLVRGIAPEDLERVLRRHGDVALVGKAFGVYRFKPATGTPAVDIVYPRREQSTGTGHREFDIQWDPSLPVEEDLRRRDFTINAIAEDVRTGEVIDPVGGVADLSRRTLRMIFSEAFREDALRVLRGIRFVAQLDLRIDAATAGAMRGAAALLATISPERVQEEFTKILSRCSRPSKAFAVAHDLGALAVVLPELDRCAGVTQNEYHPDDVFVHSIRSCDAAPRGNLAVRWAALLHDVGKVDAKRTIDDERGERVVFYGHEALSARATAGALSRLRYPRSFVETCRVLVEHHMFNYSPAWKPSTVRRFMRTVGERHLDDLFLLREADCRSRALDSEIDALEELRARVRGEVDARHTISLDDLAIGGDDVMDTFGVEPGPEVGRILEAALERVIEDPSLNDRQRLLDWVRQWIDGGAL